MQMQEQLYEKWDRLFQMDAYYDWSQLDDSALDQTMSTLGISLSGFADWEYPKGYVKLCGAQKEWLYRRFDNWQSGTHDPRLAQLNQPCNATDEKRARMSMCYKIGASCQIIGQEWGRMKRRANGQPLSQRKTPAQLSILESAYDAQPYPDGDDRDHLASITALTPAQVNGWFGHQREVRGLIAASNAEFICQPPTYVTAARARDATRIEDAAAAHARARDADRSRREAEAVASRESARAAVAVAALQARSGRELSVHGEQIGLSPAHDGGAGAPGGGGGGGAGAPAWTLAHGAVLDTGNSAVRAAPSSYRLLSSSSYPPPPHRPRSSRLRWPAPRCDALLYTPLGDDGQRRARAARRPHSRPCRAPDHPRRQRRRGVPDRARARAGA